jgi:cobalt-zinc-cadmium efflux system protein
MHHVDHSSQHNLGIAFFLNISFVLIEIAGGVFTNSMAIMSDALHDFGDSLALGLAWYFQRISAREKDSKFSYGYRRYPLMGAMINSIILAAGTVFILTQSIPRLLNPGDVHPTGMIGLAILGIVVNGIAMRRLKGDQTLNVTVIRWHLIEDVLGWVAVLIGGLVIYFFNWHLVDPILAIAIALFILVQAFRNLRKTWNIVLQTTPSDLDVSKFRESILSRNEVKGIHDLHIWSLDGKYHILTAHVIVDKRMDFNRLPSLKTFIKDQAMANGIKHVTIEFENEEEECEMVE